MDNQKQILSNHEEISELANALYGMQGEFDMSNPYEVGYVLINKLGYRKIPEVAVVLTGMETEQRFEDLMVAFDEMGFMPNTTHPFPEEYVETWKQRLIFVFGQLRKETAEKFAERLSEEDCSIPIKDDCIIITRKTIDEICKEFTGDKDEKG